MTYRFRTVGWARHLCAGLTAAACTAAVAAAAPALPTAAGSTLFLGPRGVQSLVADQLFNRDGRWYLIDDEGVCYTYLESPHVRIASDRLVLKAQAEQNDARAQELWNEVQKVLWDQGGYLIWGFAPFLDGVSKRVKGVVPSGMFALGNFDFQHFWLG